jgi:arginyl-tRNA synthetase
VFRKGEMSEAALATNTPIVLAHEAEIALGKELLRFSDVVHQAADQSLPHLLCDHLYAIARAFSVFYEACPVLRAEPHERQSRLLLVALCARQLRRGLGLLGIRAPERM